MASAARLLPKADRHTSVPNSMNYLAPDNVRHAIKGARGVFASSSSGWVEAAQVIAIALTGFLVSLVVFLLRTVISVVEGARLDLVQHMRKTVGVGGAWLAFVVSSSLLVCIGFVTVLAVPHAAGSGLPPLIAYLNGVKIRGFTSSRVLLAKFVGTFCAVAAGLFAGPEGPIIHMGACVGKQLLRVLYYMSSLPPKRIFGVFNHMRNDLDHRDFVAIGAGAGVAAAFIAPISGTLFVVEEASSHFSLSLLWRAFSAAMVAIYSTSLLQLAVSGSLTEPGSDHSFRVVFEQGTGIECEFTLGVAVLLVVALAIVGGALGTAFNVLVLRLGRLRKRWLRGRALARLAELLVLCALTASVCVLVPEALPGCRDKTVCGLELHDCLGCSFRYQQCGGKYWKGPTCCQRSDVCMPQSSEYSQCLPANGSEAELPCIKCMSAAMRDEVLWDNVTFVREPDGRVVSSPMQRWQLNTTCQMQQCLTTPINGSALDMLYAGHACKSTQFNPMATLLLQPGEEVMRALFLRGAAHALPASSLAIGLVCWFLFTALSAGVSLPIGLLVPNMVIGALMGRLYGVALLWAFGCSLDGATSSAQCKLADAAFASEPGLFALTGATALMAGSGRIRLFLTVIMLEVTDQLHLAPFVALSAIVAVYTGEMLSHHGLYHALIEASGLPYLPHERPRRDALSDRPWSWSLPDSIRGTLRGTHGGGGGGSGGGGFGPFGGLGGKIFSSGRSSAVRESTGDEVTLGLSPELDPMAFVGAPNGTPNGAPTGARQGGGTPGAGPREAAPWRSGEPYASARSVGVVAGAGEEPPSPQLPPNGSGILGLPRAMPSVATVPSAHGGHAPSLVEDVMGGAPLRTVGVEWSAAAAREEMAASSHNGYPVLSPTGKLCGLLLRDELVHFDDDARVADIMDRAPCLCHRHWPLERAHRLFVSVGLRHLVVIDVAESRPVGILTRHDLHVDEHEHTHAHGSPKGGRATPRAGRGSSGSDGVGGGGGGGDGGGGGGGEGGAGAGPSRSDTNHTCGSHGSNNTLLSAGGEGDQQLFRWSDSPSETGQVQVKQPLQSD